MYFVIDDSKLNSEAGYAVYTAGTATSVPWSGVTGKPTTFTPSSHTHPYLSALSVSGKTITYTKGDGTTGTITTQDTWRGIQNNLTSTSTTDSLSAAQGKILKGLVDGKLSLSGGILTGRLTIKGDAANSPLVVRGIAGYDGGNIGPLYLQYQTNNVIYLGNTAAYNISADGSLYSGTAANANAVPWTGVTGRPSSMPASDVSAWAKASSKPSYSWGEITGKPSTFTPASHTHNYAGSSSAGGNANAAVKLATARKIGNASFDGTANITLSQMGLNVPVEITKANYLAKKKAGTLNANTYYNVIDEYDSANVINDSSVTANSAFSSTKSEKTYAKKSTLVNTTLTASKWTGSSAPYSYVLSVSGVTSSNIVEIDYASNASSAAIEAYQNAMLADGGQTTNQITIKATEKPTVDIPITIVIRNDL